MHLFLYGERGAGKSYAIERALRALGLEPRHGFRSRKLAYGGEDRLYAGLGEAMLAARWPLGGRPGEGELFPWAFDRAAPALEGLMPGETVILDELGRLEGESPAFQRAVLEALAFPCRCTGVIQGADTPFLRRVRAVEGLRLMEFRAGEREAGYAGLLAHMAPKSMAEALDIGPGLTALVGAGGKTSLLNALGRELAARGRVILCTSTHVAVQLDLPLLVDPSPRALEAALAQNPGRPLLLGGMDGAKLCAPSMGVEALSAFADYVLVEADGARGLPLKAHAPHEPAIPRGARCVYVVGTDGFERPIREAAHRPALYAAALGLTEEQRVSPAQAVRMVDHGDRVLLNKVESPQRLAMAREFARAWGKKTVFSALKYAPAAIEVWEEGRCVY